jgi:Spy/CpxP family protein refolding chaperone
MYGQPFDEPGQQRKGLTQASEARREQLYKELDLSDEQKKLLEENKNKHREERKAMLAGINSKRGALRQELQKDELDMVKIRQLNEDLKKVEGKMLDYRLDRILEVRKILKIDQFRRFVSKIGEHRRRFGDKQQNR